MTREEAIETIRRCCPRVGDSQCDFETALRELIPELRESVSEDERTRRELVKFISDIKSISESGRTTWAIRSDDAKMCETFLAYLEKQKEQKPAEWSEEDEKIIDTIVSVLGQYIDYKAVSGTGSEYATPRYSKEIAWLKSLRHSWRPSKEQIDLLRKVYSFIWADPATPAEYQDGLGDFIDQLKTL